MPWKKKEPPQTSDNVITITQVFGVIVVSMPALSRISLSALLPGLEPRQECLVAATRFLL
jgi:hypothetical protein